MGSTDDSVRHPPGGPVEEAALLLSDAERDAALGRLTAARHEGRITVDEHAERIDAAAAARTRGDLSPLLGDLPEPEPAAAPAAPAPDGGAPAPRTGSAPAVRNYAAVTVVMFVMMGIPAIIAGGLFGLGGWLFLVGMWGLPMIGTAIARRRGEPS
ncbi:DUF1707 SHOCT-like domain-containing protein [Nocardiopsis coralliicola]